MYNTDYISFNLKELAFDPIIIKKVTLKSIDQKPICKKKQKVFAVTIPQKNLGAPKLS